MPRSATSLPSEPRVRRMARVDTAAVLKRYFHLERALTIACAAWVPSVARLDTKALLARAAWQNAMTADALRERVFELKFPDRTLEAGGDAPLVGLYAAALHAPGPVALLEVLAQELVPALATAYEEYLAASDAVADGPTHRFLALALREKHEQAGALGEAAAVERDVLGDTGSPDWRREVAGHLAALGGVGSGPDAAEGQVPGVLAGGRPFALAQTPARDERYGQGLFYWPDNFDPSYPYGDGVRLQVRSAVSHLNEVWAVETAGAILHGYANTLPWEFLRDAARWLYDESRHMLMGRHRLERWGLEPGLVPLGTFIYESCRDQTPLERLGMLAYFETKNIGKKRDRAEEFGRLGDRTSQRDMDFDWADEGIHAGYGRRWIKAALEAEGRDAGEWPAVLARCEALVADCVARGTREDRETLRARAEALLAAAQRRAQTR